MRKLAYGLVTSLGLLTATSAFAGPVCVYPHSVSCEVPEISTAYSPTYRLLVAVICKGAKGEATIYTGFVNMAPEWDSTLKTAVTKPNSVKIEPGETKLMYCRDQ